LGYTEQLVPQSISATQEKSDHCIVDRYNKGCIRFTSEIVIGKKIGEQVSVFENRIDRLTEKAGLAANAAYCIAIVPSVAADREWFDIHRKLLSGVSLRD